MQYNQLSDSEDSSDIGSGTDSSDSSSGSESESSSEGENVPMTRMNSRKIKLRKEMADSNTRYTDQTHLNSFGSIRRYSNDKEKCY